MYKGLRHNVKFEKNKKGRDFVVSDIHGELDRFLEKLEEVSFNRDVDRVFCVGDLIDRGPKSLDCLQLILKPWFSTVIGNHESFLLDYFFGDFSTRNRWMQNGGGWVYGDADLINILAKNLIKISSYTITLATSWGKIGISHAEPPSDTWNSVKRLTLREAQTILWGRRHIKYGEKYPTKNIDLTVHGHTIVGKPTLVANALYIDTGSFLRTEETQHDITLLEVEQLKNYVKN